MPDASCEGVRQQVNSFGATDDAGSQLRHYRRFCPPAERWSGRERTKVSDGNRPDFQTEDRPNVRTDLVPAVSLTAEYGHVSRGYDEGEWCGTQGQIDALATVEMQTTLGQTMKAIAVALTPPGTRIRC